MEEPKRAAIHAVSRKTLTDYQILIFDKYFQQNFKTFSTLEILERIAEEATADILPKLSGQEKDLQIARSLSDIFEWLLALANHLNIDLEGFLIQRYLYEGGEYCPLCGHYICICEFERLKDSINEERREKIRKNIEKTTEEFVETWTLYQKELFSSLEPFCLPPSKKEISLKFYFQRGHLLPLNPEKFPEILKELLQFRDKLYDLRRRENRGSFWYWIDLFHKIYGQVNELKHHWEILTRLVEDLGKLGENVRSLQNRDQSQQRKIICKEPASFSQGTKERGYLKAIFKKLGSIFAWTAALLKKLNITPSTFYHALIEEEVRSYVYGYVRQFNPSASLEDFEIPSSYPKLEK